MLKELMKAFAKEEKAVEAVETVVEAVTEEVVVEAVAEAVVDTDLSVELEGLKAELASVTANAAELGAKLETAVAALAELTGKYETAQAELAAIAAEKAALVADAEAQRLAVRLEKIVAAVGTEKADALMEATTGLDDTAFEAVVSALNGSVVAESKSKLFSEIGVAAEADASKVEESAEMRILKQKYGAK